MSAQDQESNSPERPIDQIVTELTTTANRADELVQTVKSSLSQKRKGELQELLQRIKITTEQLQAQAAEQPANASGFLKQPAGNAYGVAFAAGSIPVGAWRAISLSALGVAFGTGLLLGLVLRRK